jgi:hypothetical protein
MEGERFRRARGAASVALAALAVCGCDVGESEPSSGAASLGRPIASASGGKTASADSTVAGSSAANRTTLSTTAGVQARCHYEAYPDAAVVPDPSCTPGALNPAAVANPRGTICRAGYSERIRPPESYTEPRKIKDMIRYASVGPPSAYEEDHLVAIEDGGSPRDPRNLWPEYLYGNGGALVKDQAETRLHELICAGRITVTQATAVLEGDWLLQPARGQR